MQQYIYHFVPVELKGDTLYPLSEIKARFPDLAAKYLKKYKGREEILQREIPILECSREDVLMFSAINPKQIKDVFISEGFQVPAWRWFNVPTSYLVPEKTVIYHSRLRFTHVEGSFKDYVPYTQKTLENCAYIPENTRQHIKFTQGEEMSPLIFHAVPHVMYMGSLSTKDLTVTVY